MARPSIAPSAPVSFIFCPASSKSFKSPLPIIKVSLPSPSRISTARLIRSHRAGSDTLISFAPWAISILIIFDFLCFRFGEYPSWWRKGKNKEL